MIKEVYSKRWDAKRGFTQVEALAKKSELDKFYDVKNPDSKWSPAVLEQDPDRVTGYRVCISTKE